MFSVAARSTRNIEIKRKKKFLLHFYLNYATSGKCISNNTQTSKDNKREKKFSVVIFFLRFLGAQSCDKNF